MTEFTAPVADYVKNVFARCAGGDSQPSLLADGLDLKTGELMRWEDHTVTNLACQQNFLRTLDALGALTGDETYRQQADAWIGCALEKLRDPASGLLFWGGHTNYDLLADRPLLGNHEMKCVYPYYAYLYRVDAGVTSKFIKAFWHAHIWDWSTLLFNRHGEYKTWDEKWQADFEGGPLPIVENTALSFVNTGSDLIVSGAMLHALSGDETPLRWACNLLSRYDQIRHPETGLAGYQFNHREPCRVRASFKPPLDVRQDINEVTVVTNGVITTRYGRAAIAFLNALEALGEEKGRPFGDLVVADLEALATHCYDESDGCFHPALNDGMRLYPEQTMEGVGYCPPFKLRKVPADGQMFLSYARAYHLTGVETLREMAFRLAAGMGWGDLGTVLDFEKGASSPNPDARVNSGQNDACALMGLLELHAATGKPAMLESAVSLGRHLLSRYQVDGMIVSGGTNGPTNIDTALPLALLHLEAARGGGRRGLPAFYANNTFFDPKVVISRRKRGET